jgi:hypothetical protein
MPVFRYHATLNEEEEEEEGEKEKAGANKGKEEKDSGLESCVYLYIEI